MKTYDCDKTGEKNIPEPELTIIRLSGPLAEMTRRKELHVSKEAARELGRWFGFTILDPLDLDLDSDATAADLKAATKPSPRGRKPA